MKLTHKIHLFIAFLSPSFTPSFLPFHLSFEQNCVYQRVYQNLVIYCAKWRVSNAFIRSDKLVLRFIFEKQYKMEDEEQELSLSFQMKRSFVHKCKQKRHKIQMENLCKCLTSDEQRFTALFFSATILILPWGDFRLNGKKYSCDVPQREKEFKNEHRLRLLLCSIKNSFCK